MVLVRFNVLPLPPPQDPRVSENILKLCYKLEPRTNENIPDMNLDQRFRNGGWDVRWIVVAMIKFGKKSVLDQNSSKN